MRFEVGKVYTFLRVLFEPGKDRFASTFIPWEDTLKDIQVINLTCKEHHKVAWDQDPEGEKKYDGFVFTDAEGGIWHNQYPAACYGQMDDTNDRVVFPHFETEELMFQDVVGKWVRRTDSEATEKWKIYDSYFWKARLEIATHRLGNIYRCLNPRKRNQQLHPVKKAALQAHLDTLIEKVEAANGQKVIFEPVVMRYLDDRLPEASNFITARLSGDLPVEKLNQKYVPPGAILSRQDYEDQIPVKAKFYRVAHCAHPRAPEPKLHEAERWFPTGISETGDDNEDVLLYFHFRYAGRHFDALSFLDYNVSRLNDYNNSFMFANKKDAEAYLAFIKDPANARFFQ